MQVLFQFAWVTAKVILDSVQGDLFYGYFAVLDQFFTEVEKEHCWHARRSILSFAGVLAAKEALFKAIPAIKERGVVCRDVEVHHSQTGTPRFLVEGETLDDWGLFEAGDVLQVTISQKEDHAIACVVVA